MRDDENMGKHKSSPTHREQEKEYDIQDSNGGYSAIDIKRLGRQHEHLVHVKNPVSRNSRMILVICVSVLRKPDFMRKS